MKWLTLNGKREEQPVTAEERRDEMLSAYLDGELTPAEVSLLERDLANDPDLREALDGMREVRDLLASLQLVRAPRSFTLTAPPVAAPERAGTPRSELMTRFGAMAAAVAFGVVVTIGSGADGLVSMPGAGTSADEPAIGLMAAPETARSSGQEDAPPADTAGIPENAGGGSDEGPAPAPADGDAAGASAAGENGAATDAALTTLEAAPEVERTASASTDDGTGTQTLLTTVLGGLTALLAGLSALLWWRRQRREARELGG